VKLIGRAEDRLQIELAPREKDLLMQLLRLYPRIPSSYQPLSKAAEPEQSGQRLLDEALSEARSQNKNALQLLLADRKRLGQQGDHWRLHLTGGEVEWLLQVLNDIRVGSWIHLGSPELPLKVLNAQTAPDVWAMEIAGSFQMNLLEMLES
jgi:hypothetical protein